MRERAGAVVAIDSQNGEGNDESETEKKNSLHGLIMHLSVPGRCACSNAASASSSEDVASISGRTSIFFSASSRSAWANGPQRDPTIVISSTTIDDMFSVRLPA